MEWIIMLCQKFKKVYWNAVVVLNQSSGEGLTKQLFIILAHHENIQDVIIMIKFLMFQGKAK